MRLDALVQKYFVIVVLALVAVVAYFQAVGATQLVASALELSPVPDGERPGVSPVKKRGPTVPRKSADPILERNVFDSVTGPITEIITIPDLDGLDEAEANISDPLRVAECDGITALIVTESEDSEWSLAAVRGPGDDKSILRRVGDMVGTQKVAYIGYNPFYASPAVWFLKGAQVCQALVFSLKAATSADRGKQAQKAKVKPKKSKRGGRAPKVPVEISSKIQKVSDSEFNVDRAVVDQILENQADLMKQARIVPEQKDGKVVGIRLFGIRPDTLLGTLGFQNGDRLETINGFNMASPEKALEAYARLRTASNLNVKITRRGKPQAIDFRIK